MRLLLDTHALVWWWTNDSRLSRKARQTMLDPEHEVLVSAASVWEIATKQRIGKLVMPQGFSGVGHLAEEDGFKHWPILWHHAERAGGYQVPHADPFDRMLAAQAELDGLTLVTKDAALQAFPVERLW